MSPALTKREREIASLVASGMSNKEIARHLGITNTTVRNTLRHVFRKMLTRTRTELAVKMIIDERGVSPETPKSMEGRRQARKPSVR